MKHNGAKSPPINMEPDVRDPVALKENGLPGPPRQVPCQSGSTASACPGDVAEQAAGGHAGDFASKDLALHGRAGAELAHRLEQKGGGGAEGGLPLEVRCFEVGWHFLWFMIAWMSGADLSHEVRVWLLCFICR